MYVWCSLHVIITEKISIFRRFMADNGQRTDRRGRLPAVATVIMSTDAF